MGPQAYLNCYTISNEKKNVYTVEQLAKEAKFEAMDGGGQNANCWIGWDFQYVCKSSIALFNWANEDSSARSNYFIRRRPLFLVGWSKTKLFTFILKKGTNDLGLDVNYACSIIKKDRVSFLFLAFKLHEYSSWAIHNKWGHFISSISLSNFKRINVNGLDKVDRHEKLKTTTIIEASQSRLHILYRLPSAQINRFIDFYCPIQSKVLWLSNDSSCIFFAFLLPFPPPYFMIGGQWRRLTEYRRTHKFYTNPLQKKSGCYY